MARHLRPEARPAEWNDLDAVQQNAFRDVVKMIAEAVRDLPGRLIQSEGLEWLSPNRTSHTAFLSGDRGTGKTTVMLSLAGMTTGGKLARIQTADEEFADALRSLQQRVVWLESLDMEPLPPSANLLAAILVRVEDSVRRLASLSGQEEIEAPLGETTSGLQRALLNLQRLQRKAMLSWDGNLEARRGHLDPDTFCVEGSRTELARLSLAADLEKVLHEVSANCFKPLLTSPLFVLPVDDVDLNPQACLNLLRLLRLVSVPHLFALVLGDQKVVELVLNLKVSSELARIAGDVKIVAQLAVPPDEIGSIAGEIAANAMRKLLPPAQRVHLTAMSLTEALNFRPLGSKESDPRLYQLMKRCPVAQAELVLPWRNFGGVLTGFCSLSDVLLTGIRLDSRETPADKLADEDIASGAYSMGTKFLGVAPRRLADLWHELGDVADLADDLQVADAVQRTRRAGEALVKLFGGLCVRSLIADPAVYPQERESIQHGISENAMELGRLPLRVVFTSEDRHSIEVVLPTVLVPRRSAAEHSEEPAAEESAEALERKGGFKGDDKLQLMFAADGLRNLEARGEHRTALPGPPGSSSLPPGAEARGNERPGSRETGGLPEVRRRIKPEVASELCVYHDLLALRSPPGKFFSTLLPPELDGRPWASAEWQHGEVGAALVAWPGPPLRTFRDYDQFLSSWNETLGRSRSSPEQTVIELCFDWIALGTASMDRQPAVTLQRGGAGPWTDLGKRLDALAARAAPPALEIRDWLIRVALLLMPESGLAWLPGLEDHLERVAGKATLAYWRNHRQLVKRLRAVRLAEFVRQGIGSLASWMRSSPGLVRKTDSPLAAFRRSSAPTVALIHQFAGVALQTSPAKTASAVKRTGASKGPARRRVRKAR